MPPTDNEVNRLLRDFLEGEPEERAALRRSLNAILTQLSSLERKQDEVAADLRADIRGVSARVTILERARTEVASSMPARSIPPVASFVQRNPEDSSVFTIRRAKVEELQGEINRANAAASWQAVRSGAWKVALGLVLIICSGAMAILWRKIFG